MSTADLEHVLPAASALPRADKLRLIQALVVSIAQEDGISLFNPNVQYEIWSPYDAHEGAARLYEFLQSQRESQS